MRMASKCIAFRSTSMVEAYRRSIPDTTDAELPADRLWISHIFVSDDAPDWYSDDHALTVSMHFELPDDATDVMVFDRDKCPTDKTFRGAWTHNGKGIVFDMPKAKEILKDKLREARAPKLAALDIEYQRADEKNDKVAKSQVAAQKQVLRDLTADQRIDAANTADDLLALLPK